MQPRGPLQNVEERQSKNRQAIAALLKKGEDMTDEDRNKLTELTATSEHLEVEHRAAKIAEQEFQREAEQEFQRGANGDGEQAELRRLDEQTTLTDYSVAALEHRAASGAALELNQALGIESTHFPLRKLFPSQEEHRTTTDTDTTKMVKPWADQLFSLTKASALGVMPESISSGQASYPITKTGPVTGTQRGREEQAAISAWTVETVEKDPSRNTVSIELNTEDQLRNPQLRPALERHIRNSIAQGIDRAIFTGSSDANEDSADIVGLSTATGVTQKSISQNNKAKPDKNLEIFYSLLDSVHAENMSDLGVVLSVPANTLWYSTILSVDSESASIFKTLRMFMAEQGLSWQTRADLADATTNNKWLGFISRKIGLMDACACPTWDNGQLIVDPYSGARSAKLALTLHYFWHFAIIRPSNFVRAKYGS